MFGHFKPIPVPFKIKFQFKEEYDDIPLLTGLVPVHRLDANNVIVCINNLFKDTGIQCPLCEFQKPNKNYNFELRYFDDTFHLNRIQDNKFLRRKSRMLIILSSFCVKQYKSPLTPAVFNWLTDYPSHILPTLESKYSEWVYYCTQQIARYKEKYKL